MRLTHDDQEKVINALKTAYHDHETLEAGRQWQQNVMRDIRRLGPLSPVTGDVTFLTQLLWRAAPAVCMLILIIGVFIVNLDFVSDFELGNLLSEDPFTSLTIDSFFM
jgi:hypothetical protein